MINLNKINKKKINYRTKTKKFILLMNNYRKNKKIYQNNYKNRIYKKIKKKEFINNWQN